VSEGPLEPYQSGQEEWGEKGYMRPFLPTPRRPPSREAPGRVRAVPAPVRVTAPRPFPMRAALAAIALAMAVVAPAATVAQAAGRVSAQGSSGNPGQITLALDNATRGKFADGKIYITVLGMASAGQWSYLRPDGTTAPINHLDADAPGHLSKGGRSYPDMSFTLADAKTIALPAQIQGGRMYISLGSPLYIGIAPDDSGWSGPDPTNPADPNHNVYFDWYEFTYAAGQIPFGGNTTQVDMFGFPFTATLTQPSNHFSSTVGIRLPRAQVLARYKRSVGRAFRRLAGKYRILAPRTSPTFAPGGGNGSYLDSAITAAWNEWSTQGFTLNRPGGDTFTGQIQGGRLVFTKNGAASGSIAQPTSHDVLQCSGALASAGLSTVELELGAALCAAFNRGVALDTSTWYGARSYYRKAPFNDYAAFFHRISIHRRSYAFAYDDVNDQSSFQRVPDGNSPATLTVRVGS
jgi:hypothetical protein